jgi:hypothetical protein
MSLGPYVYALVEVCTPITGADNSSSALVDGLPHLTLRINTASGTNSAVRTTNCCCLWDGGAGCRAQQVLRALNQYRVPECRASRHGAGRLNSAR